MGRTQVGSMPAPVLDGLANLYSLAMRYDGERRDRALESLAVLSEQAAKMYHNAILSHRLTPRPLDTGAPPF